MRAFLDTNVVIDFYDNRIDFYDAAEQIFTLAYQKKIEIVASVTTFVNAFYLLRKTYDRNTLFKKMLDLSKQCDISNITKRMVRRTLKEEPMDFEDAIQKESALSAKCDVIITRNKRHFKDCPIPVQAPDEFLAQML